MMRTVRRRRVAALAAIVGSAALGVSAEAMANAQERPALLSSNQQVATAETLRAVRLESQMSWRQGQIIIAPPGIGDTAGVSADTVLGNLQETHFIDLGSLPAPPELLFGRYTDKTGPFDVGPSGEPEFQLFDRLAFLVYMHDVPVYPISRPAIATGDVRPKIQDIGVVFDARDGKFLKLWSS